MAFCFWFLFSLLSLNKLLLVCFSEMLFLFTLTTLNLISVLLNLVVGVHFFVRTKKRTKEKRNLSAVEAWHAQLKTKTKTVLAFRSLL